MDRSRSQKPWPTSNFSISKPHSASLSGLPLAAQFAATASLSAFPQSATPELEEAISTMRRRIKDGTWEPQDSQALLELLDEGWYSRKEPSPQGASRSSSGHSMKAPMLPRPPQDAGASGSFQDRIPAIRPLNLAALRDHSVPSPRDQPMFSSRSNLNSARWGDLGSASGGSLWDTPRSYVSAVSIASALPQTRDEIEEMDLEEVHRLAEEVTTLQEKAAIALRLAQARLRETRNNSSGARSSSKTSCRPLGPIVAASQLILQLYIVALTLINFVIVVFGAFTRAVGQQLRQLGRMEEAAFAAAGALVGAAQGVLSFISP